MIERGATTIWELWNGDTADPAMNSGNHVMLVGDFVAWLYEYVAGIRPDPEQPGFKHIIMKPTLVDDLKFVKATHRSPYGLISSEWHKDEMNFDWEIEVPPNTTATVYVPIIISSPNGPNPPYEVNREGSYSQLNVGSGKYHFQSHRAK
jgi:alpha-L-rhamnosidase